MSNQTARIIVFAMIFLSSTATVSYAQIVDLVDGRTDVDLVSYVELDSASGSVSAIQKMDLKAVFWTGDGSSSINGDGTVLFTNRKLIRQGADGLELINVPDADKKSFFGYPRLDRSGGVLMYTLRERKPETDEEPQTFPQWINSIVMFDTLAAEIIGRYAVPEDYFDVLLSFDISDGAETSVYSYLAPTGGKKAFLLERSRTVFGEPTQVGEAAMFVLSSSGNRLLSLMCEGRGEEVTWHLSIMKKADLGWSEPTRIELPGLTPSGLYDAANNGKTLLVNIEERGLALVHETPDGWSEPEYLGYQLDHHPLSNYVRIQMSEDGSVIAVSSARLPVVDPRSPALDIYDLYVFLRREPGIWEKTQVNPPEYPPFKGDFLLSQNGRMLYWVPETPRTSITNPDWTLHR
ncbi:MAG TPA: hypothetical protein PLQ35_13145 [bacterium]|nr:hypothetical protein [bacterium]HQL63231.1 hypothetical protein [bacterium]